MSTFTPVSSVNKGTSGVMASVHGCWTAFRTIVLPSWDLQSISADVHCELISMMPTPASAVADLMTRRREIGICIPLPGKRALEFMSSSCCPLG